MTKKLEELFNLDSEQLSESTNEDQKPSHEEVTSLDASFKAVQEITKSLPEIKELDNLDERELDDLAKKAETAYDDLLHLGMNVEIRYSGRIFEVAGTMMKNAIDAKSAKIDKKLKAIDLQLKKYKIDKDNNEESGDVLNGVGFVITDRNELLKKLGQKS